MKFLEIMNSSLLFILVELGIAYVLLFCGVTLFRSYRHGVEMGTK